jgi:carboxylesterase
MSLHFSFNSKLTDLQENELEPWVYSKGSNGSAVILIHGLTGSPHEMKFLAKFLNTEKGYSVICPRLANHGKPIQVLKRSTWQDFYESVRQAFFEVEKQHDHIFAAGLSMGALLSLLLAHEFKNKVKAVSCLSPTLFYDGWNIPWYQRFLPIAYFTPLKNFIYFKEEPPYGIKNEKMQQLIHRIYSKALLYEDKDVAHYGYAYFALTLFYQLHLLKKHLSTMLSDIKNPVQLIQAAQDDVTSVENSKFIYDRIDSPKKELLLLENSYHVITADQEREKVAQNMYTFFNSIRVNT